MLSDLTKHPGWQVLKSSVDSSAEKRALGLAKVLLFETDEVDTHLIAYERGYYKAMHDLVRIPEKALSKQFREE